MRVKKRNCSREPTWNYPSVLSQDFNCQKNSSPLCNSFVVWNYLVVTCFICSPLLLPVLRPSDLFPKNDVCFLFVLLFSHNLRINMMSKHLFSYSTSKNLENIWLGSQQISTLWMNKTLAATTTRKKSHPLIWYFINSELRFDLLMTPHSKQLDAGL